MLIEQNRNIRDNIIGHSHFDAVLYQKVVKACDLEKDFSQLPQGDGTVIGSKGLALSGGQKQRVVSPKLKSMVLDNDLLGFG